MSKKSKGRKSGPRSPQDQVRALIKSGAVKKKCCRSDPRCRKCPVLALRKLQRQAGRP